MSGKLAMMQKFVTYVERISEDVKMYDVSETKELVKSSQSQSDES